MRQMTQSDWTPIQDSDREQERLPEKTTTLWQDIVYQYSRRKTAVLGLVMVVLIVLAAIVGPMLSPYGYNDQTLQHANLSPWLKVYQLGENRYTVTTSCKLIAVTDEGRLDKVIRAKKDDGKKKRYVYELEGATYYLNYRNSPATLEDQDGNVLSHTSVWNRTYLLGTDGLGRDILVRLLYGARISLTVAFIATLVTLVIGILYGSISGYLGGMADAVMMRIVDIISAIPLTMYVILIMVVFNNGGLASIIIALGSVYWVDMARVVRGEILSLKSHEFVAAAQTMGSSTWYILKKHLIPNALGPIIVTATMQIPSAIFTEAFMSFIGLGVSAPMASWGTMCNDALETMQLAPYQLLFPAGAVCLTMFAFNFIGDGLRDAFDPQMRK